MQQHVVTNFAIFADGHMRMRKKIPANLHTPIHSYIRQEGAVIADLNISLNDYVSSNGCVLSNSGRGMNDCRGMNASIIALRLMKELDRLRVCIMGILDAQCGLVQGREVFVHNERRGLSSPGGGRIFGVRNECDLSWSSGLNGGNSGDFHVSIRRLQTGADPVGDVFELHGSMLSDQNLAAISTDEKYEPVFAIDDLDQQFAGEAERVLIGPNKDGGV